MTAHDGWFNIKRDEKILAPDPGFGIKTINYYFGDINFQFVEIPIGNPINYDITFHLQGKDINYKGSTTSGDSKSIPVDLSELPKGYNVRIDISAVYKGKTYNDTFYKVLNNGNNGMLGN